MLTCVWLLSVFALPSLLSAAEAAKRRFELEADLAVNALRKFAVQSGTEVLFGTRTAEKVRTNAVQGEYTPYEAMKLLLAGTGLVTTQDRTTGALTISADPNARPATPRDRASDSDKKKVAQTPQTPHPMEKNKTLAALASAVALFFSPAARSAEGDGAISGRVLNATNGSYLEKARITIPGTSFEAFTDSFGEYRFAGVRTGQVQVTAFHTGLAVQTATVTVTAGQTVRQDFSLQGMANRDGVVKLDAFVVATSKEMDGAAIATNEQRFAPNIRNVVAADEFGAMADGNVGELLKFVPGVTLTFIAGEAAQISLDGVSPNSVPITVGGFDLASARINTNRAVELSQFSVNNVARIEVSHTPTPEIPGAALAGSINMVPRSAFERATPRLDASISVSMLDRLNFRDLFRKTPGPLFKSTRKAFPGLNFSYIRPVNERFGFTLSGSTSAQNLWSDWTNNTWRGNTAATNGTTFPDTTPDRPYRSSYNVRVGHNYSERSSLGATFDFKLSPNDSLSVTLQYGYFHGMGNYRTQNQQITRILPGDFSPTFTHGAPGAATITTLERTDDKSGRTYMPSITYRHRGPIWKMEAGASHSHSTNSFAQTPKGFFQSNTMTIAVPITMSFDDSSPLRPGKITVTDSTTGAPVNQFSLANFRFNTVYADGYQAANLQRNAFANVGRDFFGRVPLALKAGLDVRQSKRDLTRRNSPTYNFVGADGIRNSADDSAAPFLDPGFSQIRMPYGFPNIERTSNKALYTLFKAHPEYFVLDEVTTYQTLQANSKYSEETVSAAYVRGDAQFFGQRLKLVGGLRAEQTNVEGQGRLIDPTLNQQKDARGNVIRDASGRPIPITTSAIEALKLTNIERGLRAEKEYLRWFPSLNASFNVTPDLIARIGHYWSVGRPNLVQYAGALTLPDTANPPSSSNRITINNAGIKAWNARSTKATLEYYFSRGGFVSISGFRRDIDNFFISSVIPASPQFLALYGLDGEEYAGYEVSTQINSPDKVRMEGYNINYKQALTFLPEWARGVQVFANFNSLRATGAGADNFTGFIPRTINWGVSLSRARYNLKVNWNYRGFGRDSIVTGRSIEAGTYVWNPQRMYVDCSADYSLTKRLAVFASVRNLNSVPENIEFAGPSTPDAARLQTSTNYGAVWVFGVKGSF